MAEFKFAGRTYYHNAEMLTPDQLYGIVGASKELKQRSRLVSVRADGTYIVDDHINLDEHSNFDTIPRGTIKGSRELYVKTQVASIAEVYGERYGLPVQIDERLEWLFIPRYPLPGRWGARESPILIQIPPQYPSKPPSGFFISKRCNGPHVLSRNVYHDVDLSSRGWNWCCVHCDDGWKAGSNPMDPSNLWTFLKVVRTFLTVGEF